MNQDDEMSPNTGRWFWNRKMHIEVSDYWFLKINNQAVWYRSHISLDLDSCLTVVKQELSYRKQIARQLHKH